MTTATAHAWLQAPWDAYLAVADTDPEAAEKVTQTPFRALARGNVVTLASLADDAGMGVDAYAEVMEYRADEGRIRWDQKRQGFG